MIIYMVEKKIPQNGDGIIQTARGNWTEERDVLVPKEVVGILETCHWGEALYYEEGGKLYDRQSVKSLRQEKIRYLMQGIKVTFFPQKEPTRDERVISLLERAVSILSSFDIPPDNIITDAIKLLKGE